MTCSKDHKQKNDDYSSREKVIKVSMWIVVVLCVALIANIIFVVNSRKTSTYVSEHHAVATKTGRVREADDELENGSCVLKGCTVECYNTSNIYNDVFQAFHEAHCEGDFKLEIYSQPFPYLTLINKWIPAKKVITEVSITNGGFTFIRNEAFNCIDFTKTLVLNLVGLNVSSLGNGVLLGLSNLRSLHMEGKIGKVDRCFFQPVQSSLIRLRVGADLTISGDKNIFGISFLPNIEALDLSDNFISGPVTRKFFLQVPNVQCITLSNSKITSIAGDAFDDIAENLHLLDLSNNLLTSVDESSFERILILGKVNLYLLGNNWNCNCELKPLIDLYDKYENRFGDIPYCKAPIPLYGVLFTNVTFNPQCNGKNNEDVSLETTLPNNVKTESTSLASITTNTGTAPDTEITTTKEANVPLSPFQMRCSSVIDLESDEDSSSSEEMEYFLFAPPCHEFELILMKNNSVQVTVEDPDGPINIVWFSDAIEDFVYTIDGITVDYNCEMYIGPYLIIHDLHENTTYTFCLVPSGMYSITPFNCLPLHVPKITSDEDTIWISNDDKQFTVGIICLIFTCSMLLGGVVAYFGIKAYPDLLEGSRHVLVVKKSDQTRYVSTITEGEYMFNQTTHKSCLKKRGSMNKSSLPFSQSALQFNTFPTLPPPIDLPPPPPPFHKEAEALTNESLGETDDHYELPCIYNKTHECKLKCIPNKYAISPMSPPPLPKRNSDVVLYSSNSDLLPEKPHPKMSF